MVVIVVIRIILPMAPDIDCTPLKKEKKKNQREYQFFKVSVSHIIDLLFFHDFEIKDVAEY